MRRIILAFVCFAAFTSLISLSGCGDGRPRCYPVSGVVKVDGKVLTGQMDGTVRFIHVTDSQQGRPATGYLDETGRFTLTSYDTGDGCPKGTYKVELYILQTRGNKMFYLVPPRYEHAATSDIQVEITGQTPELVLEAHWLPEDEPDRKPIIGGDGAS